MAEKTVKELYDDIVSLFYDKTKIDIEPASVLDMFSLSTASMLKEAYDEIEDNKTPHIYTSLSGSKLDDIGILCGIAREANESDKNYLYRILKWNTSNKTSNLTAIENSLMNLVYSSHVTYVPQSFGCGTATAYIIPEELTTNGIKFAIQEVKNRLKNVTSPSTHIEYVVPSLLDVGLTILIKTSTENNTAIKNSISDSIIEYINSIAPGAYLELGEINRIGNATDNVQYFNVQGITIDGDEIGQVSIMQEIETKFLISENKINYLEVE